MKERILKTNNDDGEYLKYRKDLKSSMKTKHWNI